MRNVLILICSSDIVSICTDLAVEYAALGRTDRANNMFDLALAEVERDGFNVSNEARFRLFVRYAEATVINGNMEQGLTAYAQAQDLNDLISEEPVASGPSKGLQRATTLEMAALAAHAFSSIQFSRVSNASTSAELLRGDIFKDDIRIREIIRMRSVVYTEPFVFGTGLQILLAV